jgi:pilus assembly protein CpaB
VKRKRFIAALLALALAAGGAGSMWWYAQGADARAMEGLEAVDVFVATGDIPAGTSLGSAVAAQMLAIQQVPKRLAPTGASVEVDATNSTNVALNDIHTGELVLLTRFAPAQEVSAGLSIPNGYVAVTVSLGDPQRVASFVHVGSQVAIFLTYPVKDTDASNVPSASGNSRATRLLLSKVLVLGVGAATGQTAQSEQLPSALLTVAVAQQDAERLIQALSVGTLYLALMNDQSSVTPTIGTNTRKLFG